MGWADTTQMTPMQTPLRSDRQFRLVALLGPSSTLVMLAIGFWARTAGGQAFSFVFAGVIAGLTVRGLLAGVDADEVGLRIRGMLLTRTVSWSELESFSFEPLGILPAMGVANLRDGRRFPISAISAGHVASTDSRSEGESLIARLNEALGAHRSAAAPAG
jgi:hypothetical protein